MGWIDLNTQVAEQSSIQCTWFDKVNNSDNILNRTDCSSLDKVLVASTSWWIMQWLVIMSGLTHLTKAMKPELTPSIAGAPSVQIPQQFCKLKLTFSTKWVTRLKIFIPLVHSLTEIHLWNQNYAWAWAKEVSSVDSSNYNANMGDFNFVNNLWYHHIYLIFSIACGLKAIVYLYFSQHLYQSSEEWYSWCTVKPTVLR